MDARGRAKKFLEKQKATFANYLLDETSEEWQTRLAVGGPPVIYVFNRDNQWVAKLPRKDDDGVHFNEIEKLVVDLLKQ
jgi:hypothetical protein